MRSLTGLITVIIFIGMVSFRNDSALTVTSTVFTNNSMIPVKYSCEGEEISPPLQINNVPKETKTLALILHDPDAPMQGGFTHWVMWNMAVDGVVPENFKGASQGLNGAKQKGYKGMCPPTGLHHYNFKVYALDTRLSIGNNTDKAALEKAMQGHIIATGELTGLYKKLKEGTLENKSDAAMQH